jgi:hypothetical protein
VVPVENNAGAPYVIILHWIIAPSSTPSVCLGVWVEDGPHPK